MLSRSSLRVRKARVAQLGVEDLEDRRLLSGDQYWGGSWNPANWGIVGAVNSAANAVASTASDISHTVATDIKLLPIIVDQLPAAYQQTLESGAQFDSVLGYIDSYTDLMNPFGGGTNFGPLNPDSGGYQTGQGVGTGTAVVSQLILIGAGGTGAAGAGMSGGTLTVPVIGVMQTSGGLLTTVIGTTEVAVNTGVLVNGGVILVGVADLGLGILQMTGDPGDGGSPDVSNADRYGIDPDNLDRTGTVASHAGDRPYINSPTTIRNIIESADPIPDPGGVPGALRWDVSGTFQGSSGVFELVIDPTTNRILHFLFRSSG